MSHMSLKASDQWQSGPHFSTLAMNLPHQKEALHNLLALNLLFMIGVFTRMHYHFAQAQINQGIMQIAFVNYKINS